jgi:hypothetical protein
MIYSRDQKYIKELAGSYRAYLVRTSIRAKLLDLILGRPLDSKSHFFLVELEKPFSNFRGGTLGSANNNGC